MIIYRLHYNPQHVSSSTLLIFRRTNCIITASGIVTLEIGEWSYINKMRSAVFLIQTMWSENVVISEVNSSELVKCSSENICLVTKFCKMPSYLLCRVCYKCKFTATFTSILTFITDPSQEVARHFTKFYDKANVFTAACNKLTRIHFTNHNIFTSHCLY